MAEERHSANFSEQDLVYRMTGNERDEFDMDENMPWQKRLDLFAGIELELGNAEIYLEKGVNKFDVYGDMKDVQEAVTVLKASAEHHAKSFTPEQLREAAEDPRTDIGLLAAVADRRAATERNSAPQSLAERMKAADVSRDARDRTIDERQQDEGRDEKG